LIARKNRKLVILSSEELIKWNKQKHEILLAKFTQIPIAKKALLLTHKAILLHGTRGILISQQLELEKVRNKLNINTFYYI